MIEFGHWGQHTLCVTSEEDNVLGVRSHCWQVNIFQEIEREGCPRVGSDGNIVKVDGSRIWVEASIFNDAAISDGVENFGFNGSIEVDDLGIASALDVENSIISPASFIISNDLSLV